jgi:hypothetical protein
MPFLGRRSSGSSSRDGRGGEHTCFQTVNAFYIVEILPRSSPAAWTSRSSQDHHISRRRRFPRVCPISLFPRAQPPPTTRASRSMQGTNSRDSPGLPRRRTPSLRFDRSSPHERRLSSPVSKNWPGRERLSCVTDYHSSRARHSYLLLHSVAIWSGRLVIEADGGVLAGEKATACT